MYGYDISNLLFLFDDEMSLACTNIVKFGHTGVDFINVNVLLSS